MFEWSKHFGYGTMTSVLKKRRVVKETMQINTFRFLVSIYESYINFCLLNYFLLK